MGKKKANQRKPTVVRVMSTPTVNVNATKAADAMKVEPTAGTAAVAATQPAAAAKVAATTTDTDDVGKLTRKEEVAAMPRMGGVTNLKPVTNCTPS